MEPVYFLTDFNDLVRHVTIELVNPQFVQENRSMIVTSLDDIVQKDPPMKARDVTEERVHLDRQKGRPASAYYDTFVDLILVIHACSMCHLWNRILCSISSKDLWYGMSVSLSKGGRHGATKRPKRHGFVPIRKDTRKFRCCSQGALTNHTMKPRSMELHYLQSKRRVYGDCVVSCFLVRKSSCMWQLKRDRESRFTLINCPWRKVMNDD